MRSHVELDIGRALGRLHGTKKKVGSFKRATCLPIE
jgi:hypothetical protein